MKKTKYLLILSLIAIVAACFFVGCNDEYVVDRSEEGFPYSITYCANGGTLNGKTERYFYVQENALAIQPSADSSNNIIVLPGRVGYKLVGWVKGEADKDGNPVLVDEHTYLNDGGVWMNFEGAITEDEAIDKVTGEYTHESVTHKYYKHGDVSDENIWWDFKSDIVTENIVLIAMWEPYNKFILAERDVKSDIGWEDLSELTSDSFKFGSETHDKYADRLHDVSSETGLTIEKNDVDSAFRADRAGYTPIKYYSDAACNNEIEFPYTAPEGTKVAVIYYSEIQGDYTVINNPATAAEDFTKAINDNKNVYMTVDVNMRGYTGSFNGGTYSGTIIGNYKTIYNMANTVTQTFVGNAKENTYGSVFGILDGAEISNLTIVTDFCFTIAVNPADRANGKELDKRCEVGAFSKELKNTTLNNVSFTARYIIDRSEDVVDSIYNPDTHYLDPIYGPNDYDVTVTVSDWCAKEAENSTMDTACVCDVKEMTDEEKEQFLYYQHNGYDEE